MPPKKTAAKAKGGGDGGKTKGGDGGKAKPGGKQAGKPAGGKPGAAKKGAGDEDDGKCSERNALHIVNENLRVYI